MWCQKLRRTFVFCALVRRAMDTRVAPSIVWFPTSCAKEVTSPITMELVASPFMELNLPMRTLSWNTLALEFCPWPMLDPTPMVLNSSYALSRPRGALFIYYYYFSSSSSSSGCWVVIYSVWNALGTKFEFENDECSWNGIGYEQWIGLMASMSCLAPSPREWKLWRLSNNMVAETEGPQKRFWLLTVVNFLECICETCVVTWLM